MNITRLTVLAFIAGIAASFFGGTLGLWAASSVTAVRVEPVFVYGTLENPITRTIACQCFTKPINTEIRGFTEGRDSLHDMQNGVVQGKLVMFSQEELKNVDTFIGFPETHYRITVEANGELAWAYVRRGAGSAKPAN